MKALKSTNPLNYVIPLTVNLYFKKENPGPGEYSPRESPRGNNEYKSVFSSKSHRGLVLKNSSDNFLKYEYTHQTLKQDVAKQKNRVRNTKVKFDDKKILNGLIATKNRTRASRGTLSHDFGQENGKLNTLQGDKIPKTLR